MTHLALFHTALNGHPKYHRENTTRPGCRNLKTHAKNIPKGFVIPMQNEKRKALSLDVWMLLKWGLVPLLAILAGLLTGSLIMDTLL